LDRVRADFTSDSESCGNQSDLLSSLVQGVSPGERSPVDTSGKNQLVMDAFTLANLKSKLDKCLITYVSQITQLRNNGLKCRCQNSGRRGSRRDTLCVFNTFF